MVALAEALFRFNGHAPATQTLPFIHNSVDFLLGCSDMDHHTLTYSPANGRTMRTEHELVVSRLEHD